MVWRAVGLHHRHELGFLFLGKLLCSESFLRGTSFHAPRPAGMGLDGSRTSGHVWRLKAISVSSILRCSALNLELGSSSIGILIPQQQMALRFIIRLLLLLVSYILADLVRCVMVLVLFEPLFRNDRILNCFWRGLQSFFNPDLLVVLRLRVHQTAPGMVRLLHLSLIFVIDIIFLNCVIIGDVEGLLHLWYVLGLGLVLVGFLLWDLRLIFILSLGLATFARSFIEYLRDL